MQFFVISDIHGSESALKKAVKLYREGSYRKMVICGDILYHGARNPLPEGYNPKGIIEILNSMKSDLLIVRGNCESEVDSMVLETPIKSDYSQIVTEKRDIFVTHGHQLSPDNPPELNKGSIFLSGHTHIPTAEDIDGVFYFNPGSISLPKGGYEPSYGILTEDSWEVRDLNSSEIIISTGLF